MRGKSNERPTTLACRQPCCFNFERVLNSSGQRQALNVSSHFMKTPISIVLFLFLVTDSYSQTTFSNDSIIASLQLKYKLSDHDHLDNVMRFNSDTILISGYLGDNSTSGEIKNIVYQTFDGGKTWKIKYFKGDAWIYDAHFENDGKVWMGGSDEYIHFSTDYGTTWTIKPKPFIPINRVLSIYMTDSLNGIAGGLHNGLALTNDNWQTTKQIPSPLDQNKFSIIKNSARSRINKVQIIDSLILINQNEHIYYSRLNPVNWKAFNIPVRDFSINKPKNRVELFSIGNKVYVLDSKLNLLGTYLEPEDFLFETPQNEKINVSEFLTSNIKSIQIEAVKYDFDKMDGGCIAFPLYKQNIKRLKIREQESFIAIKEILASYNKYENPKTEVFSFSQQDSHDYLNYYRRVKKERQEEKVWGGDFTYLLDIENELFLNQNKTIDNLNQALLAKVLKIFSNPFSSSDNAPYVVINIVNNKSDTIKITSKNSNLYNMPWTIEYKNRSFRTYDTRITELLKTILPKAFTFYDNLFAGELIYRLIEQRIIDEMTYKNGY